MRGLIAYLDSSSIVKRYVEGSGSKTVRDVYLKAYSGESTIAFSSWNIMETLGAFDEVYFNGYI